MEVDGGFSSLRWRRLLDAQRERGGGRRTPTGARPPVIRGFHLVDAMRFLRDDPALAFECLRVCAVDYLPRVAAFEVVYTSTRSPRTTACA